MIHKFTWHHIGRVGDCGCGGTLNLFGIKPDRKFVRRVIVCDSDKCDRSSGYRAGKLVRGRLILA